MSNIGKQRDLSSIVTKNIMEFAGTIRQCNGSCHGEYPSLCKHWNKRDERTRPHRCLRLLLGNNAKAP